MHGVNMAVRVFSPPKRFFSYRLEHPTELNEIALAQPRTAMLPRTLNGKNSNMLKITSGKGMNLCKELGQRIRDYALNTENHNNVWYPKIQCNNTFIIRGRTRLGLSVISYR